MWILFTANLRHTDAQYNPYSGGYGGGHVIAIQQRLCNIPQTLQGEWFSREDGDNVITVIDSDGLGRRNTRAKCMELANTHNDNFTILFRQEDG